jgi:hypothetical protein
MAEEYFIVCISWAPACDNAQKNSAGYHYYSAATQRLKIILYCRLGLEYYGKYLLEQNTKINEIPKKNYAI